MCFFVLFFYFHFLTMPCIHFKCPTACPKNAPSFCVFCSQPLSHLGQYVSFNFLKVSNGAKIRNRYNQVPHLTLVLKEN